MLVMAALPAILLAGCGGAGGSSGDGGGAYRLSAAQFNYLAGAGMLSSDQTFLFKAEQRLRQVCMERKGFAYYPAEQARLPEEIVANNVLTASGRPPSEAAQLAERMRVGYGIFNGNREREAESPPNDVYVRSMTPQQQARYAAAFEGDGVPGGGCLATTEKAIYGGSSVVNSLIDTPQRIRDDISVATQSDPLVVKATAAWSRCLQQRTGRRFATPDAVPKWLAALRGQGADLASARATEIRFAVADTKCGYSVGLEQAYSSRFRWHADHLPANDRGALLSLFEIRQRSIARAKRLLHLGNG
jgi:hypothetical protein